MPNLSKERTRSIRLTRRLAEQGIWRKRALGMSVSEESLGGIHKDGTSHTKDVFINRDTLQEDFCPIQKIHQIGQFRVYCNNYWNTCFSAVDKKNAQFTYNEFCDSLARQNIRLQLLELNVRRTDA